jgi:hypothetical protein
MSFNFIEDSICVVWLQDNQRVFLFGSIVVFIGVCTFFKSRWEHFIGRSQQQLNDNYTFIKNVIFDTLIP